VVIAALSTGSAVAGDAAAGWATGAPPAAATGAAGVGWQIEAAGYGWLSGFRGTTATLPPLPAADVDLGFRDVLSDLDGALMGLVYARQGRLIVYGDVMYAKLSVSERFNTPVSTALKLSTTTLIASGGVGYSVVDTPAYGFDVLAGARLYNIDTDATLSISDFGVTRSGGTNETWVDPMVGARFSARLADRWYLTSWAFAGGFDVGSRFSWDLFAGVAHTINDRYTVIAGYRGLGIDYKQGDYVYDVVQTGPIVGVKVHF
jgi:hypothetical protein